MKRLLAVALVAMLTLVASLATAASSSAADAQQARGAKNTWMTKSIRQRIIAAGTKGVKVSTVHRWARAQGQEPQPSDICATADLSNADVYANSCMIYPFQCTMNFIYKKGAGDAAMVSDGANYFIGTAGHCVHHANQPVFIQNGGVIVHVGYVDKILHGGGMSETSRGVGGLGNDFASVRILAGHTIDPRMPVVGGPEGIYTGCAPKVIAFYGHGFVFAVAQGQPGGGLAHLWFDRSYAWAGDGVPGDSGSGVVTEDHQAAGNLTHLNIDFDRYFGATHAGTRLTRILTFLGGQYYLVNQDYTVSRADMSDTRCGNANSGEGGGSAAALLG